MSLSIPKKYQELVNLVLKHHGCIFGGAVRDFLTEVDPNDIDISMSDLVVQDFYFDLLLLGYEPLSDNKFVNKFVKGNIIADVVELPEDSEVFVDIYVPPDFDVNTLAWDGKRLFNYWVDTKNSEDTPYDITEILAHIAMRKTTVITLNQTRLDKMTDKGWVIIYK